MSSYKTAQRRVRYRGRDFHFVSYEGRNADPARAQEAIPPTWFLMAGGKRWVVGPQQNDQAPADLDQQLARWLDENIFGSKGRGTLTEATAPDAIAPDHTTRAG